MSNWLFLGLLSHKGQQRGKGENGYTGAPHQPLTDKKTEEEESGKETLLPPKVSHRGGKILALDHQGRVGHVGVYLGDLSPGREEEEWVVLSNQFLQPYAMKNGVGLMFPLL